MILRPRTPKSFIVEISACRWSGFGGMQDKFDSILPLGSGRNDSRQYDIVVGSSLLNYSWIRLYPRRLLAQARVTTAHRSTTAALIVE
jgi:hypothetical protein